MGKVVDKKDYGAQWPNRGAERLYEYIRMRRLNIRSSAQRIGCSPGAISCYLAGRGMPSLTSALTIQKWTKGWVTCEMWIESPTGEPSRW